MLIQEEEWHNIPNVVKNVIINMNNEITLQKNTIDAIRRENKDMSALLRRVIQKQTDVELEVAKNLLSPPIPESNAIFSEKYEAIENKLSKINEKMKKVELQLSKTIDEKADEIHSSMIANGETHDQMIKKILQEQERVFNIAMKENNHQQEGIKELLSRILAHDNQIKGIEEALEKQNSATSSRIGKVSAKVNSLNENISKLEEKFKVLSSTVEFLSSTVDERTKSLLKSLSHLKDAHEDKLEKLSKDLNELDVSIKELARSSAAEMERGYVELRKYTSSLDTNQIDLQKRFESELKSTEMDLVDLFQKALNESFTNVNAKIASFSDTHSSTLKDFEDQVDKLRLVVESKIATDKEAAPILAMENKNVLDSISHLYNQFLQLDAHVSQLSSACNECKNLIENERALIQSATHSEQYASTTVMEKMLEEKLRNVHVEQGALKEHVHSELLLLSTKVASLQENILKEIENRAADRDESFLNELKYKKDELVTFSILNRVVDEKVLLNQTAPNVRMTVVEDKLTDLEATCAKLEEAHSQQRRAPALHMNSPNYKPEQQNAPSAWDFAESENYGQKLSYMAIEIEGLKRHLASLDLTRADEAYNREVVEQTVSRQIYSRNQQYLDEIQRDSKTKQLDTLQRLSKVENQIAALSELHQDLKVKVNDDEGTVSKLSRDMTRLLENVLSSSESMIGFRQDLSSELNELQNRLNHLELEKAASDNEAQNKRSSSSSSSSTDLSTDNNYVILKNFLIDEVSRLENQISELRDESEEVKNSALHLSTRMTTIDIDDIQVKQAEMNALLSALPKTLVTVAEYKEWKSAIQEEFTHCRNILECLRMQLENNKEETLKTADADNSELTEIRRQNDDDVNALRNQVEIIQTKLQRLEATLNLRTNNSKESLSMVQKEAMEGIQNLSECYELLKESLEAVSQRVDEGFRDAKNDPIPIELLQEFATKSQLSTAVDQRDETLRKEWTQQTKDLQMRFDNELSELRDAQQQQVETSKSLFSQCTSETAALLRSTVPNIVKEELEQLDAAKAIPDPLEDSRGERDKQILEDICKLQQDCATLNELVQKLRQNTDPSGSGASGKKEEIDAEELKKLTFSKQELEERFANLWDSIVSLVARKEDSELVNKKLAGLQKLMSEETKVQLSSLSMELNNILVSKVSFSELQEMLSKQMSDGNESDDDNEDRF